MDRRILFPFWTRHWQKRGGMEVRRSGLKQRIGVLCHELNGTDR